MGKLRGVNLTSDLLSALDAALALPQPEEASSSASARESEESSQDAAAADGSPSSSPSSSSTSPRSMSSSSPPALLEKVQRAKRDLSRRGVGRSSSSSFTTAKEARSVLEAAVASSGATTPTSSATAGGGNSDANDNDKMKSSTNNSPSFLPLAAVQAIKFLIDNSSPSDPEIKSRLLQRLESALRETTLSFAPEQRQQRRRGGGGGTSSSSSSSSKNTEFEKRLERLRLQCEERSYTNLTTNLKNASSLQDDNVTAKSMMYATSVGLNMVVAPITFGVFMYFFAGSIFARFFDDPNDVRGGDTDNVDIRRVIAGVVSGVFMLFVEMILFVIRSHELDASVRKKGRRRENRANPFGYTKKSMERVYVGGDE